METRQGNLAEDNSLGDALFACLQAVEAGDSSEEVLARYPEFTAEITEFLADRTRFDQLAAPLREAVQCALTTPAAGDQSAGGPESGESVEGRRLGDYELLEEISRGGMGVVFKARHRRLNRIVALKVLRTASQTSAADVQRFRNEAEIIAALDHPRIVAIHEVGEEDGRLYFSMKLMEGGSLAERLARFRDDPRLAAGLVAQVARAMHHAHQRGVLHRDLKPSNILLDAAGQPYVTDFGLARRLQADPSMTVSGALVGTPGYMAPEQAWGQKGAVTTASDVYGLGAVLYALLTGRPPFRGDTLLETLEQVRSREPEPPRISNDRVSRDLETVCLKCLEKDPQKRYLSAEALAEDLDRWLRGEPVLARRVGAAGRLWRWGRRNPLGAGFLAVVALAVLVLAVSTGLIWREKEQTKAALKQMEKERQLAELSSSEALLQRRRAESNLNKALNAMARMPAKLDAREFANVPRIAEVRRRFAEHAIQTSEDLLDETNRDPGVRADTARVYLTIGELHHSLGAYGKAKASYEKALGIHRQLVAEFPADGVYRHQLGHCHVYLAGALLHLGKVAAAAEEYRQAIGAFEESIRLEGRRPWFRNNLAWHLAQCPVAEIRNPARAVQLAKEAIELAPNVASMWNTLGVAQYRAGDDQACIAALTHSMKKSLSPASGNNRTSPPCDYFFLAMAHWRQGQKQQARQWYDTGSAWMDQYGPIDRQESYRLRAEAAVLMGIPWRPPTRADVVKPPPTE